MTSQSIYQTSTRPSIALITNHGYAGVDLPIGGAADTGGQNLYVNSLAHALDTLGYKVTIFTRGGFPFFNQDQIRDHPEYLSDHIRYIFIPGGGNEFLRKEDIAIALDEEIDWLDQFIRDEAEQAGCNPWEVYEFVNTHYWDAAVMGVRLIERWHNDIASQSISALLNGLVPQPALDEMHADRHWLAVGQCHDHTLGRLLLDAQCPSDDLKARVQAAAAKWTSTHPSNKNAESIILQETNKQFEEIGSHFPPDLLPMLAANTLGTTAIAQSPAIQSNLQQSLLRADTHAWTPHSLGELKDANYRNRPVETRRDLKFCERRNHERMVADRTRAIASTSTEMAEQLWTNYKVPVDQTFYFPPCLDLERFRVYNEDEMQGTYAYLTKCSGLTTEQIKASTVIFETSRMDHTKRKDVLIDAFAKIADSCPGSLLFIGGGPTNEVFDELTQTLSSHASLKGRAFLLGPVPDEDIGPLFSLAQIYVTPSEMEGFGMSASQATAADSALVSSDMVPFSVNHVPNDAIICPAGDVDSFAAAIKSLLDDPEDRQDRANRLAKCVDQFDWVNAARTFINHLNENDFSIAQGITQQTPQGASA